jgi:hypothetical protein
MKKRTLRDVLDGDIPNDVCHWIVEFHDELDERNLTPLQAAHRAYPNIARGHSCRVTHVRSGLEWSVDLLTDEVIELKPEKPDVGDIPKV